eukprot:1987886-Prymnesium_polylepis.1
MTGSPQTRRASPSTRSNVQAASLTQMSDVAGLLEPRMACEKKFGARNLLRKAVVLLRQPAGEARWQIGKAGESRYKGGTRCR